MSYLIATESFSKFERRLNNTVMQTHEAVESPEGLKAAARVAGAINSADPGWRGKISSAVDSFRKNPVKIFS